MLAQMSEGQLGIVVGVSASVVSAMFAFVLYSVDQLSRRFDAFNDGCRLRHEAVVSRHDFDTVVRDVADIKNAVGNVKERIGVVESSYSRISLHDA